MLCLEAARLSAPLAFLRPLTFARVFQNLLSAFPEEKMFITHLIYIRSYARTWREWGTPGVFSLRGFSRPSRQQTFALYPSGLYPVLPLTLEVSSALSNPSTKVKIYPKMNWGR